MAKPRFTQMMDEIGRILASAGNTTHKDVVARALLKVFDRTEVMKNYTAFVCYAISSFNPRKLRTSGDYKFETTWPSQKWGEAIEASTQKGFNFERLVSELLDGDEVSAEKAAAIVTKTLEEYDGDAKAYVLAVILYSQICPFNYWVPESNRVNMQEWDEGLACIEAIRRVDLIRLQQVRFRRATDFSAMIRTLTKDLPDKDKDIVLGYVINVAKEEGMQMAQEQFRSRPVVNIDKIDLASFMEALKGANSPMDDSEPEDGFLTGEGGGHC